MISVLLPIAGAPEALERCLRSLERPAGVPFRLVLILDGPQPGTVETLVSTAAQRLNDVRLVRLQRRQGWVRALRAGQREGSPDSDEVWLNSDTELPSAWLAALLEVAESRPKAASVTPWSNHGTLTSFPIPFAENLLPRGWDVERLAEEARRTAREPYPEIPTGVGFCCLVRRAALDSVGTLDEAFASGYGAEVDWCLRARQAGWVHLLAPNTFVFHLGGASFGKEAKLAWEQRAERKLRWKHPDWWPELATFLQSDPLQPHRQRFLAAVVPPRSRSSPAQRRRRILHVVHGLPPFSYGGTERFAELLARSQAERGHEVTVLARWEGGGRPFGSALEELADGIRIRWISRPFSERDPLSRNALVSSELRQAVRQTADLLQPDLVHVHHLAGFSLDCLEDLFERGIPVVVQLQDWWLECARANRWHREERLCSGPTASGCGRCLPMTRVFPSGLWNRLLYLLRRHLARRLLRRASALISPSALLLEDLFRTALLSARARVEQIDYAPEVPCAAAPRRRLSDSPLTLGFLGTLLPHKGLHLLLEAIEQLDAELRPHLRVWGRSVDPTYTSRLALERRPYVIEWRGSFDDPSKDEFFASIDLLVVPSLGLESYGFAAAEALASGVPVLVSDRGELPARIPSGGGVVFPAGDSRALAELLADLQRNRKRLESLCSSIPAPASFSATADQVELLYSELLQHR